MKRLLLPIVILLANATVGTAQEFYLKGGVGYAVPHGTQPYDAFGNAYSGSYNSQYNAAIGTQTSFSVKKPSLTAGLNGTIGVGILVSEHIGVELDANIGLVPRKYEMNYEESDGVERTQASIEQQANMPVLLSPALVLQTGGEKLSLYSRTGLVIPVQSTYTLESTSTTESLLAVQNVERSIYKEEFKTRFGVGFSAAVGVRYKIAELFSIFSELNVTSLTLYARESEVKEYIVDGVNYTNTMPDEYRTTKYEFKASSANSTTNTYSTFAVPYGNFGFTAGVIMSLH